MYTIEEIYLNTGQFDEVATISFKEGTSAYELFGKGITGKFLYTLEERKELEKVIKQSPIPKTIGFVKFNVILENLSKEKKKLISTEGFLVSDIIEVFPPRFNSENPFTKNDVRSLPEPMIINVDFSNIDSDMFILNSTKIRVENGYILTPFEKDRYMGTLLRVYGNQIPEETLKNSFIDADTRKIKEGIEYYYLKDKNSLTAEEDKRFLEIKEKIIKQRTKILIRELKKSTEKLKELNLMHRENLKKLIIMSTFFEPKNMTNTKFPVWLDYDGFIHIFMKHIAYTQVGKRYEENADVLQYNLKDSNRVMELVLKSISTEIQHHFETNPSKPFFRNGKMCVYFNGDYYVVDIAQDGKLRTFYCRNKKKTN